MKKHSLYEIKNKYGHSTRYFAHMYKKLNYSLLHQLLLFILIFYD